MHPMTHVCDRTNHPAKFNVVLPVGLILYAEYIPSSLITMHQSRPCLEWNYTGHHPRGRRQRSAEIRDSLLLRCRGLPQH